MRSWMMGIAVAGMAAGGVALAARGDANEVIAEAPPAAAAPVRVALATEARPRRGLTLHALTRPADERRLAFVTGGRLVERAVEVGDAVEAGALLARVDDAPFVNALQAASSASRARRAQAQLASVERARMARLEAEQAATEQQATAASRGAETALAAASGARIQVAEARRQLEETQLVAPFSGRVVATAADVGEVVGAGQPVLTLRSAETEVELAVPARHAGAFHVGDAVRARLPEDGTEAEARVTAIVDGDGRPGALVAVRLSFPAEAHVASGRLVEVDAATEGDPALLVPHGAVDAPAGRSPALWVVREGRAVRVPARLVGVTDDGILVDADARAGEPIVTEGGHRLLDGDAVEVQQ